MREACDLSAEVVHHEFLEAREERFGELEPPLPEPLLAALRAAGIARLWSHQTAGIEAARRGQDVLVTTPTASGKSLIFQLPILEQALGGGQGRALFLFPLKALGQDQRSKLAALAAAAGLDEEVAGCAIYDGDTPDAERRRIRSAPPRVLITNPDMLHLGILAHWQTWTPFLAELRWLVLDELHTYRGIFGSHFHHVLQRLDRICRGTGSRPSIIASSATAANAGSFAGTLARREFVTISETGAPRNGRHLVLLRPEGSPYTTALEFLVGLLDRGLKTIVFTKARRITELLYSWLRRRRPDLRRRVASYRAGFLPEERRGIEKALAEGELDGVVSTSALEMGVDIGGLDACVLVGYPGSVMATWQRSGRVGRSGRESVTFLIAMPDALDQYFLDHPRELLERPLEELIVDPNNDFVVRSHLLCAAAEKALEEDEDGPYLERHRSRVTELLDEGSLLESADGRQLFALRRRPHREVSLRGGGNPITIRSGGRGRALGTVDHSRGLRECHPGAVYLHRGRQYLVEELDLEERVARARRVNLDYFTTPLAEKQTEVLEVLARESWGPLHAWLGRVRVTERVVGFERKQLGSQQVMGQSPLDLPPTDFETVGLWWLAGSHLEASLVRHEHHFLGSLHATEHAAISLMPTFSLCDRGDIGGISQAFHPQLGSGGVFIYDGHSGGVGIAASTFKRLPDLLGRVLELLDACPCEEGCPSCVQSPKCGNGNRPLDKAGAARCLRLLLAREEPVTEPVDPAEPILVATTEETTRGRELDEPAEEAAAGKEGDGASAGAPKTAKPRAEPTRRSSVEPAGSAGKPELPSTVLFDLETLRSADEVGGWGKVHRMGIALGVVCFLEENRFEVYREERVKDLAEALRSATLVIGFNSRRFDYQVLSGYTGEDYNRSLPTLDLLEDIHRRLGFRLGLGHLCSETLGAEKSADGLQSLEWVREGRLDLVEAYCRRDVELLRDLYLFGRREGYVLYRKGKGSTAKQRKLPVDW
ncbi:MAG: DEAD/DEAH box helicase [Acidobacteria bacterium]|nr:DEAD/DEAH box helicase [Acidobacteriota bacterium]